MRKFKIKLPDDVLTRRIQVLAGSEVIAIKEPGEDRFRHKTARCNMCGLCCSQVDEAWHFGTKTVRMAGKDRLVCALVEPNGDKWECRAGPRAPWACTSECSAGRAHFDCVIRYEE